MKPPFAIGYPLCFAVSPMDYYLLLERIGKKVNVAVSRISFISDSDLIYSAEEVGVSESDCKAVSVIAQIVVNNVQIPGGCQYLIIETFFKYSLVVGSFIDHHLESGDFSSENFIKFFFDRQEKMQMIGHQGILIDFQGGMDSMDILDAILDGSAERRSLEIGAAVSAFGEAPVAGNPAEIRGFRMLFKGDVVYLALSVVMPRSASIAGPNSAHDCCFEGLFLLRGSLKLTSYTKTLITDKYF